MIPKPGSNVLYKYPGQKTPKGRDVLDTLPALVIKAHEDGTLDIETVTPFGTRERRNYVRPLSSRDPKKHLTEADFYVDELTVEEQAKLEAERKAKRKAELEKELADLNK